MRRRIMGISSSTSTLGKGPLLCLIGLSRLSSSLCSMRISSPQFLSVIMACLILISPPFTTSAFSLTKRHLFPRPDPDPHLDPVPYLDPQLDVNLDPVPRMHPHLDPVPHLDPHLVPRH
ncbi:hypothetical protein VIGAN_01261700 [Vigna angularis var. angularis]|uniref:Uncharacterized protein n=1 Tax=Vigna angularis var. angularis TaxID=157739 RepID=A0A0S3R2U6_PHAAN|nr:hypothetical protein VIGAN_01261700 [Vigna angularis var. angularis]